MVIIWEVFYILSKLQGVKWVKVGFELFLAEGPNILFELTVQNIKQNINTSLIIFTF